MILDPSNQVNGCDHGIALIYPSIKKIRKPSYPKTKRNCRQWRGTSHCLTLVLVPSLNILLCIFETEQVALDPCTTEAAVAASASPQDLGLPDFTSHCGGVGQRQQQATPAGVTVTAECQSLPGQVMSQSHCSGTQHVT